jgi:hypothetical protein
MPYSLVYKARYLDGTVGYLTQSSNVYVPGFSNALISTPGYIGKIDDLNTSTTNLNFVNMNFSSSSLLRASNVSLVSNITGSNLYSFTNTITAANINFINYLGTLQPYANTMSTGNLIVRDTLTANNFRGATWLLGNLTSQTNTFAVNFTGSVNTYANSILTTTLSTRNYIGSALSTANLIAGNIVAQTLILNSLQGSNILQTDSILTVQQVTGGRFSGNLFGVTYAANAIGYYLPYTNVITANTVTVPAIYGGSVTSYTNLISSTTVTCGNVTGAINTYTNTLSTTSTLRAASFFGGFATTGNITTTGTVTGTTLAGAILGANTLSTQGSITAGALVGGLRAFANGVTCTSTISGQQFIGALNTYANNISVTNVFAPSMTALSFTGSSVSCANIITGNIIGTIYANTIQTLQAATATNFIGDINLGSGPLTTQNPLVASNIIGSITAYSNNISIDQSLYSGTLIGSVLGSNNMETTGIFRATNFYGGMTGTTYIRTLANMSAPELIGGTAGSNIIQTTGNVVTLTANFIGAVTATTVRSNTMIVGSLAGNIKSFQNNIATTTFIIASNVTGQMLAWANTISTQANISYGIDLNRAGVFTRPDLSNTFYINQSLTHLMGNSFSRQLAWSTPSQTTSISYYSTNGQTGWTGSVLLPDGRVCFVPDTATSIGFFNPRTNTFSNIVPVGDGISSLGGGWRGGVLMPDSNVVFFPNSNAFLCMYDPVTNILSKRQSPLPGVYLGGCLLPNGNVLCVPNQSGSLLHELNPYLPLGTEQKFTLVGSGALSGCALRPDGTVLLVPQNETFAYIYKYDADVFNSVQTVSGLIVGPNYYSGAVYLPTGRVLLVPNVAPRSAYIRGTAASEGPIIIGSSSFGCMAGNGKVVLGPTGGGVSVFDVYSELSYSVACNLGHTAPVATPCGRVVFSPQTATGGVMVMNLHGQIPLSVALSPYYNKI